MQRAITHLSFADWVLFVFDHPAEGRERERVEFHQHAVHLLDVAPRWRTYSLKHDDAFVQRLAINSQQEAPFGSVRGLVITRQKRKSPRQFGVYLEGSCPVHSREKRSIFAEVEGNLEGDFSCAHFYSLRPHL